MLLRFGWYIFTWHSVPNKYIFELCALCIWVWCTAHKFSTDMHEMPAHFVYTNVPKHEVSSEKGVWTSDPVVFRFPLQFKAFFLFVGTLLFVRSARVFAAGWEFTFDWHVQNVSFVFRVLCILILKNSLTITVFIFIYRKRAITATHLCVRDSANGTDHCDYDCWQNRRQKNRKHTFQTKCLR